MRKKGLTLFEILISMLIMSLVFAGLANIFIVGRRYILHSRSKAAGGELGRSFLDPLQLEVKQAITLGGWPDGWDQEKNALTVGTRYCDSDDTHTQQPGVFCPTLAQRTLDNIVYSAKYEITDLDPTFNLELRKVKVTISWTEPSNN